MKRFLACLIGLILLFSNFEQSVTSLPRSISIVNALSGLENLGTAGRETLTEPPAPAIISIDMKPSYEAMVQRLGANTREPNTPPYVIYKVGELLIRSAFLSDL